MGGSGGLPLPVSFLPFVPFSFSSRKLPEIPEQPLGWPLLDQISSVTLDDGDDRLDLLCASFFRLWDDLLFTRLVGLTEFRDGAEKAERVARFTDQSSEFHHSLIELARVLMRDERFQDIQIDALF